MSVLMAGLLLATKKLHVEFEWEGRNYSVRAKRAPLENGPGYHVELLVLDGEEFDTLADSDGVLVLDRLFAVNAERAVEQIGELGTRAVEGCYPLSPEGIAARQERARLLTEFTKRRAGLPQMDFGPYPRVTEVVEATDADIPVVVLRFHPQVVQNDMIVPVDVPLEHTWRVPRFILRLRFPTRESWETLDTERDMMRSEGDAPQWVRDWDGPFEVALADGEDPWAQAEDDAATERPEPIPDHEARWTVRFPYIDDMGSVAPIHGVQDKVTETKEEEALWHLNDMRKHDGLPPRKSLPKGTTFERTTPRESVLVDFRVFPEGDVIALMPDVPAAAGRIMSYQTLGQHGPATPELRDTLRKATPEERGPLLRELIRVGYDVRECDDKQ